MKSNWIKVISVIIIFMMVSSSFLLLLLEKSDAGTFGTIEETTANANLGYSISSAGDVNGDGFDDVIVGAPGFDNDTGRAYIFYGGPWLKGNYLPSNANITIKGIAEGNKLGYSVSTAGDVNNDGFDDVIIGSPESGGIFQNSNTLYRKKLTFNNSGQNETLLNSPILIKLTPDNFNYSNVKADGSDIRFFDDDGSTELNYHIERWNPFDESFIWVNVPAIDAGSDTDFIWIHYGNPYLIDPQNTTGTYDENYLGVWHLNEDSGAVLDSTINNHDGGAYGSVTRQAGGMVDSAYDFDGFNDHLNFGTTSKLQEKGNITLEAWVNIDTVPVGVEYAIIQHGEAGEGEVDNWLYKIELISGGGSNISVVVGHETADGVNEEKTYNANLQVNTWYHLAAVRNTQVKTWRLYINGQEFGTPFNYLNDATGGTAGVLLAAKDWLNPSWSHTDGTLDEIRISTVPRNSDWIKAQYLSMTDNFTEIGLEENAGQRCGGAYLFYGSSSLPAVTDLWQADFSMSCDCQYGQLGSSVSDAGDINNDGYDDIIIGAPGNGSETVRVYYGSSVGLSAGNYKTIAGGEPGEKFGFSIDGGFDVDGDSYDDLIVGAPNSSKGSAYIYLGGEYGTADHKIFYDDFETDLSNWDDHGVTDWDIDSSRKYEGTSSVRAAELNDGDIISDDIDLSGMNTAVLDFWFYKNETEVSDFNLYFYDGSVYNKILELESEGPDDTWLRYYRAVDLSKYGISDFRIKFNATLGAGEFALIDNISVKAWNNPEISSFTDGFETDLGLWDDNGASAWEFDNVQFYEGASSIMASNPKDGYLTSDNIDLSGASMAVLEFYFRKLETDTGDFTLQFFDGTAYNDILDLSAAGPDNKWLRFYRAIDLTKYNIDDFQIRFNALMNAGEYGWVDGLSLKIFYDYDIILTGLADGDSFGYSVAGVGNIDGQYYDDILIGAPNYSAGAGGAFLFFGDGQIGSSPDVILRGEVTGDELGVIMTGGNFNGDGYGDLAVSSLNAEKVYVLYGNLSLAPLINVSVDSNQYEIKREADEQFGSGLGALSMYNQTGMDFLLVGASGFGSTMDYGKVYIINYTHEPIPPASENIDIAWARIYNETDVEVAELTVGDSVSIKTNLTNLYPAYEITGANITIIGPDLTEIIYDLPMSLESEGNGLPALWERYRFDFINPTTPGTYTVNITVYWNNVLAGNISLIYVLKEDEPYDLKLKAEPAVVTANGVNSTNITINIYDRFGNPIPGLGSLIIPSIDQGSGSFGAVNGYGNGTYNITYTAPTSSDPDTVVNISAGTVFNTTLIVLVPDALSYLGITPSSTKIMVNQTKVFDVKGFDKFDNPVELNGTIWSTDLGSFSLESDYSATFKAQTNVKCGFVGAAIGSISVKAAVSITPGPLSRISITPDPVDVIAGGTQSFFAAGFDIFDNPVELTETVWSSDAGVIAEFNYSYCKLNARTTLGKGYVSVVNGTFSAKASVMIIPNILDHIIVTPSKINITAGTFQNFTAAGYDIYGNTIAINPSWIATIGSMVGTLLTADIKTGFGYVNASIGPVVGTAEVTVIPDSLNSISVTPNYVNIEAGSSRSFSATGYDKYYNSIIIDPVWITNAGKMNGAVLTAKTSVGSGTVEARVGNIYGFAIVNIIPGQIHHITIDPEECILVAGEQQTFYAYGFDRFNNTVAITPIWYSSVGEMNGNILQTSIKAGKGTVTATHMGVSGVAVVTIIPAELESILVTPSHLEIIVGGSHDFQAVGFDKYFNTINITPVWTTDVGIMNKNVFTARNKAGGGTVSATVFFNSTSKQIKGTSMVNVIMGPSSGAPVIAGKIPDQQKTEDCQPWSLDLSSYETDDIDIDLNLRWYATGENRSLYILSGEYSNDDILKFTPVPNAHGNNLITLWLVDSTGLSASQQIWVNLTPVNDAPTIFGAPDLIVHYDDPYIFNFEPYINDLETPVSELTIQTMEVGDNHFTEADGLNVTFNYPESMTGQEVFVTIMVSDGELSAKDIIIVKITDDWVPKLVKKLPDVTLYEGTIAKGVFNLNEFFIDPDKDSLFYSYGQTKVKVIINEDHSVDISSLSQWYGIESVTFRAEDPFGALAEDTIKITVLPLNDPPAISGVPDLIVHFDYDYRFDLTNYLSDVDNSISDLELTTSDSNYIWFDDIHDKIMVINYPESMNDMSIPVTITVSDGLESASQTITVKVTDDYPPEKINDMPDVEFEEDTGLTKVFDLDNYFKDIDGDSLYYSYGNDNIFVEINNDNTVNFSARANWFGNELISFRAADPIGAIAEDTIMVMVLPVNDAPMIDKIPAQSGMVGEMWMVDLSPFVYDIDNNITELEIKVNSSLVVVSGLKLLFYSDAPISTTLTVELSDGDIVVTEEFHLTVFEGEEVISMDSLMNWTSLIIIIIILVCLAAFIRKYRGKYRVEEVFLIYENGILIAHKSNKGSAKIDHGNEIVSSMLAAVQDFIKESFVDKYKESSKSKENLSGKVQPKEEWQLQHMKLEGHNILIERGNYEFLAIVFSGSSGWRLHRQVRKTIREIEKKYSLILPYWDGLMNEVKGIDKYLDPLIEGEQIIGEEGHK